MLDRGRGSGGDGEKPKKKEGEDGALVFLNAIERGTSGDREKKGEGERLVSCFWPRLGTVSSGLVEEEEKV